MKKINISTEELINMMSDKKKYIGQGHFGLLIPYDSKTLIKIYYKNIFDGYYYLNEDKLNHAIEIAKAVDKEMKAISPNYSMILEKTEKKFDVLQKIGLLKGKVFTNDYMVGLLLAHYTDYMTIDKIFKEIPLNSKIIALENVKKYLEYLMQNNVYPWDIWENNIIIRKDDLDVKIIDLDGSETRYEEPEYIEEFSHIKEEIITKYSCLCRKLIK